MPLSYALQKEDFAVLQFASPSSLPNADQLREKLKLSQNKELRTLIANYVESLRQFVESSRGDMDRILGNEIRFLQEDIVLAPAHQIAQDTPSEWLWYEMPRIITGQVLKSGMDEEQKKMFLNLLFIERTRQWVHQLGIMKNEANQIVSSKTNSVQEDQNRSGTMINQFILSRNFEFSNEERANFAVQCSSNTITTGDIITTFYPKSPINIKDENILQKEIDALDDMRVSLRRFNRNVLEDTEAREKAETRSAEYQQQIDHASELIENGNHSGLVNLLKIPFDEVSKSLLNKTDTKLGNANQKKDRALNSLLSTFTSILPSDLGLEKSELEQALQQTIGPKALPQTDQEAPRGESSDLEKHILDSFSEQPQLRIVQNVKSTLDTARKNYDRASAAVQQLESFKKQLEEVQNKFDINQIPRYLESLQKISKELGYKDLAYQLETIFLDTQLERLRSKVTFVLKEESSIPITDQAGFFPKQKDTPAWQNTAFQIVAVIALLAVLSGTAYYFRASSSPESAVAKESDQTPAPFSGIPAGPVLPQKAPENKEDLNLLSSRFLLEYAIDHPNADGIRVKYESYGDRVDQNFQSVDIEMSLDRPVISSIPDGKGLRLVTRNTIIDFYPASFPALKSGFVLKHPNITLDPQTYLGALFSLGLDRKESTSNAPGNTETELRQNDAFARFLLEYTKKYRGQSQYAQVGSYTQTPKIGSSIDIESEIKKGGYQIKYTKAGIMTFTSADTSLLIIFPKLDHLSAEYKNADSKLKNKEAQQFLNAARTYVKK